jgi:hypothetical protein
MSKEDIVSLVNKLGAMGHLAIAQEFSQPFDEFFQSRFGRRFANSEANRGVLENAWAADGGNLTASHLETIASDPDVYPRLALDPTYEQAQRDQRLAKEQAEREAKDTISYRATIFGWCEELNRSLLQKKRIDNHQLNLALRVEQKRLEALDYAALYEEYTRRSSNRALAQQSRSEARVNAREMAKAQPIEDKPHQRMQYALQNQYEKIPMQHTTRGGLTVDMTRAGLIKVANTDAFAFRELVRRYGAESINEILAGRGNPAQE